MVISIDNVLVKTKKWKLVLYLALISSFGAVYAFVITHKDKLKKYDKPDGEFFSAVSSQHQDQTQISLNRLRKNSVFDRKMRTGSWRIKIPLLREIMDSFLRILK